MWKRLDVETWKQSRFASIEDVTDSVVEIIDQVRHEGDKALRELTKKFDRCEIDRIAVSREEIEEAYEQVDEELLEALELASMNIERFHEMQFRDGLWLREMEPGVTLGVKTTPLQRVGVYVPGGRASYPSTALMCVIPARVAQVEEVVCCTPSPINPITLVALDLAGVDEIYRVGGVQAIAAMAMGTESIAPVQKIVGPGNAYVTAAKTLLRGMVEIDFPAGPSEIGIIADATAVPDFVAADILAQAEHDPKSACVLVTMDESLVSRVEECMKAQIKDAPRRKIMLQALENSGYILVQDMEEAVRTMDAIAPEHLSLQVADSLTVLNMVQNAGSIFVGPYAPVSCGDYASGTNHVLPTAGHAASFSGLDVAHFQKKSTVQIITREGLENLSDIIEIIAEAEGLMAHAEAVRVRRSQ
ncbi:MAG: histidinol dehydrogenase [Candidatus Methanomethylophilaceae archaeon]